MPDLATARAINAAFSNLAYRPTALFVGGTSGIGEGTASAFARATKGNARILLCGRNKENAEGIMAGFPRHPDSKYEFVPCEASLMKNVVTATDAIKTLLGDGTLNYLVLSQGIATMNGFTPTSEGIDRKLALHFYSRWKFVDGLLPKLEAASKLGQEARVMSILSPGDGSPLDVNDLGLKKSYSLLRAARQVTTYNDLFVDEYSKRYAEMAFIHAMPGIVDTPLTKNMPWYVKLTVAPIAKLLAISIEDCGEWMATGLTSPEFKKGSFYITQKGDRVPTTKIHLDDTARATLVAHYKEAVATA